jgi:pimeloyl-ACP methyl ester carboxylesterase
MSSAKRAHPIVAILVCFATAGAIVLLLQHTATGDSIRYSVDQTGRLRAFDVRYRDLVTDHHELVRTWKIMYTASNGVRRQAYVLLPKWYSPSRDPRLPLVISPHGRGVEASVNARFWGGLPAYGPFIVVCPEGQGRILRSYSWGWKGQIDDLARMPGLVSKNLPWVKIDSTHVYAVGSSMGGQETLLLVAEHPRLLAGAAALDSATDMIARYDAFAQLPDGQHLQQLAREEIGGTPLSAPAAYAARSPVAWADQIAASGVPLQIWWSTRDRIVNDQWNESGRLFLLLKGLGPRAPVTEYVGQWAHSHEYHAGTQLARAMVALGLIRLRDGVPAPGEVDRTVLAVHRASEWTDRREW